MPKVILAEPVVCVWNTLKEVVCIAKLSDGSRKVVKAGLRKV